MIIENIPILKVQKLTQEQYDTALQDGILDDNSIYLTPTEIKDYALKSDLKSKADLDNGKVPLTQLPTNVSTFNNDVGYLTSVPEGYVTETKLNSVIESFDTAISDIIGSGVLS